ncbi:MAG: RraA family protein [Bryobacteraceae bacterium]
MRSLICLSALAGLCAVPSFGQLGMFTTEQRTDITRSWKGDRFPDGRPKVPDEVLQRLKHTTAEEAWGTLRRHRFNLQFEGNWKTINVKPGERLVGRAVTAQFMPRRPDMDEVINAHAKQEGRVGHGQNSWVIDTLVKGDVMVVDLYGKIDGGTIIGDNLGTSIMTKTGTGLVVNGAVRDPSGLSEIDGFKVFARGFHPSAIAEATLMGWNIPIRIGHATVLPGDVVLSDPDGITFIPAELAEEVADESELTQLRDDWGHTMLREQKYAPGQIDAQWTPQMIEEFNKFAESKGSKMRMKTRGR